ncbi:hypothetical protein QFC20_005062 [Naganishia adeliensis]|uniref:Uncharacterized protein n=1 Tax=Naganishia adeliensis TaxID=92952 RepID=A0ACC2VS28_9TREE|nr:hypothetical protein QFC20_005062 [Naganishia adeliensis]
MLKGVGNNQTHGWIAVDMHFVNEEGSMTSIKGAFHVVTALSTKITLGNDVLAEEGALIDLKEGICSFKTSKGTVAITSNKPKSVLPSHPVARLQEVYTIKPGFQARVPVSLSNQPSTSLYILDPVQVTDDIMVSRSVAPSSGSQHYAHVLNVGNNVVKLPADLVLANISGIKELPEGTASSNIAEPETPEDRQAFEAALLEVDINPELSQEEKQDLERVIRDNRQAFSYGSRRLGRTNITTMSIETGTAAPTLASPLPCFPGRPEHYR